MEKSLTRSNSPRSRARSASAAAYACNGGVSTSERRASSVSTARCTRPCFSPSTKMICFWIASLAKVRRPGDEEAWAAEMAAGGRAPLAEILADAFPVGADRPV